MRITVDLGASAPQYEQIRQQVAALIAAGSLGEGDRLPTVRALAADLGIAAGTVARAYRDLEEAGLVATRRRAGTIVTSPSRPRGRTSALVRELVAVAADEGLTQRQLLDLVHAELLDDADRRSAG
ncbi:GntR family transcriptional regulator [Cellulomonas sp. NPDC058312]|uniref:GntR family transcriptional regulator n=1 Tax=Cellulomonas sp. NPDC058312 TaxID=3346441 RepID=UPI0036E19227